MAGEHTELTEDRGHIGLVMSKTPQRCGMHVVNARHAWREMSSSVVVETKSWPIQDNNE